MRDHSLSLVAIHCRSLFHLFSLVAILRTTRFNLFSIDVSLVCPFINDSMKTSNETFAYALQSNVLTKLKLKHSLKVVLEKIYSEKFHKFYRKETLMKSFREYLQPLLFKEELQYRYFRKVLENTSEKLLQRNSK